MEEIEGKFEIAGSVSPVVSKWVYCTIDKEISSNGLLNPLDAGLTSGIEKWKETIEEVVREEMDGKFEGGFVGGMFHRALVLVQLKHTGCLPDLKKFSETYFDTIFSFAVERTYDMRDLLAHSFTTYNLVSEDESISFLEEKILQKENLKAKYNL